MTWNDRMRYWYKHTIDTEDLTQALKLVEKAKYGMSNACEELYELYKQGNESAHDALILEIRRENETLINLLLQRIKEDNDNDSIDLLLESKRQFIANVCWHYFQNREQVEDMTQETCIKAIKALREGRYEFRESLRQWLFVVAENVCLNALKSMKTQKNDESRTVHLEDLKVNPEDDTPVDLPSDQPSPEEIAMYGVRKAFMKKLIDRLPKDMQDVLNLLFYHGCSYEEVASILGVEVGTIKSRRNRAIEKLKEMIKTMSFEEREVLFSENRQFQEKGGSKR